MFSVSVVFSHTLFGKTWRFLFPTCFETKLKPFWIRLFYYFVSPATGPWFSMTRRRSPKNVRWKRSRRWINRLKKIYKKYIYIYFTSHKSVLLHTVNDDSNDNDVRLTNGVFLFHRNETKSVERSAGVANVTVLK